MTTLLSGTENGVLTLRLNRPERANAFNAELIGELQDAFARTAQDSQTRVIVLTGAGRAFSAGQDIGEMQGGAAISYRAHLEKTYNPLILQIRKIEKPVIAALNGPCAGAAFGVALACDLRLASDETKLVVGFGGIALVPDSAVSLLLPALIGLGRAQYYFMTNEAIMPQQALEWGLVNKVFSSEKFMPETNSFAAKLAAGPVGAFGLAKQAFNKAVLPNLEEALRVEADLQEIAGRRDEHKEGVSAFMEKRKPKFQ
ncbi:MAG: enoyl-CoA hydratase/isomerase family protein [Chloroflexi bacterium]|nr:enoyl-CoA hydratase/isomerase family protein [Chloroflexota bacterium]